VFHAVLIYDVSRWGRFQDSDESAFYEYRCRRAGVKVEYVAEDFSNDGTIGSDLHKVVKRRMAAEYSRELSVKVFAGQKRTIENGFKAGSRPGYALRRQLVDEDGTERLILAEGERKYMQTDRVRLVPGPADEIANLRWIFDAFGNQGLNACQIARSLNDRGIVDSLGLKWNPNGVSRVLRAERYVGDSVWNRTSDKLGTRRTRNPPDEFIRKPNAWEALIDRALFDKVQVRLTAHWHSASDEEFLEAAKDVLARHGELSTQIINKDGGCPSMGAYARRFGGLAEVRRLIGCEPLRDFSARKLGALCGRRRALFKSLWECLASGGVEVQFDLAKDRLIIGTWFKVGIVHAFQGRVTKSGRPWLVRSKTGLSHITIVIWKRPGRLVSCSYLLFDPTNAPTNELRFWPNADLPPWVDCETDTKAVARRVEAAAREALRSSSDP
jgi:DNA invertase Pin-like site-specific DNA recombinase